MLDKATSFAYSPSIAHQAISETEPFPIVRRRHMKVLVSGYNHFGFISAIANGFQQLEGCRCDAFMHPYTPVRKMVKGAWFKRVWHGLGTKRINQHLLEKVKAGRYDFVLCIEGGCVFRETIATIRTTAPVALWCLDSMRHLNMDPELLRAFTKVFFFEPTDYEIFPGGYYLPIGFDNGIYHRLDGQEVEHDIIWVGSAHNDRLPKLDKIARFAEKIGYDLGVYGYFYSDVRRKKELREDYPALFLTIRKNAKISPDEANLLYNSARIAVNLHFHDPLSQGINPRTFEVPGSGCFLLTDHKVEIEKMLNIKSEIATFKDMDEFAARASYYLAHQEECRTMAERAHHTVHANHTFAARCREMVEVVAG
jgi:hypothetical protein